MTPARSRWTALVLLFTLLVAAFNTRTVIAAVAPIADELRSGLSLGTAALSLVATLPPLCFAVFAAPAPALTRRAGVERGMGIALALVTAGQVIRTVAGDTLSFVVGTIVALAGIGVANVLLPPLVRRHFGGRIGGVTAGYVVAQSVGTALPALFGVPAAQSWGWRVGLGLWAVAAAVGLVLWLVVMRKQMAAPANRLARELAARAVAAERPGQVWRSPVGWAVTALFAVAASHAYAMLAWLPLVVTDLADVSRIDAGSLLALYGAVGTIPGIVMPILAARVRDVGLLVHAGFGLLLGGYLGLLFHPALTAIWVVCAGVGAAFFALCLALVNLRTRTPAGTVKLSGFVQGVGYCAGALGPLVFGLLHELTGGWTASLWLMAATSAIAFGAGLVLRRPMCVEDEWHGRRG